MSNWAAQQRQLFITERLDTDGWIQRKHLVEKFNISVPQASLDLAAFIRNDTRPIRYDKSLKRYVLVKTQ